jgi:cytoskeletal protein CcmA (bactofilin family)
MSSKYTEELADNSSLETPGTVTDATNDDTLSEIEEAHKTEVKKIAFKDRIKIWKSHFNVYILVFVALLIGAAILASQTLGKQDGADKKPTIANNELDKKAEEQLQSASARVGDPKQTLAVEANTVFSGGVLVRGSLEVAGPIKVGGSLSLPGITVSGNSSFDQVQINKLVIAGDEVIQGSLNVQKNVSVAGSLSIAGALSAGQINIEKLTLNQDLVLNRHIDAAGGTPGKSDGTALGGGGTASLSGNDTAGTVTMNIGGGAPAGVFISINFVKPFSSTPHVIITPVGSAAAGLDWYVANRTATGFSIATATAPAAGTSFSFDYIVID